MSRDFEGQRILITGGSSGIGKATAKAFLDQGAEIALVGTSKERLSKALQELKGLGRRIFTIPGDVSTAKGCKRIVEESIDLLGGLKGVVNSAGLWIEGPGALVEEEDWDRVIDTNLKGTFFICRYAIPALEKTRGWIVNLSSDAGIVGNANSSVYCASKGGVSLLTKSLALELAPKGIRVNAVCPGEVDTPMLEKAIHDYSPKDERSYRESILSHYPQGKDARFIQPEEVASAILFLASPKAEPITGSLLSIDFGITSGY